VRRAQAQGIVVWTRAAPSGTRLRLGPRVVPRLEERARRPGDVGQHRSGGGCRGGRAVDSGRLGDLQREREEDGTHGPQYLRRARGRQGRPRSAATSRVALMRCARTSAPIVRHAELRGFSPRT
jgi:hypothetical protein